MAVNKGRGNVLETEYVHSAVLETTPLRATQNDKNSGPDDARSRARQDRVPAGALLQCNKSGPGKADEAREGRWKVGISKRIWGCCGPEEAIWLKGRR